MRRGTTVRKTKQFRAILSLLVAFSLSVHVVESSTSSKLETTASLFAGPSQAPAVQVNQAGKRLESSKRLNAGHSTFVLLAVHGASPDRGHRLIAVENDLRASLSPENQQTGRSPPNRIS